MLKDMTSSGDQSARRSREMAQGHIAALSIRQPWAALIASGHKTIETRSWYTPHRGLLLVVSALRHAPDAPAKTIRLAGKSPKALLCLGCAIAVVTLLDCRPMLPADAPHALVNYNPRLWAWILDHPRPIRPVPVSGRLRLFSVQYSPDPGA